MKTKPAKKCRDCGELASKHEIKAWPNGYCGVCTDKRHRTTKKPRGRSLSRTCIFDPVRRLLPSLDEMQTCMNGRLKQYSLAPELLAEGVELHLDDADDGSSDVYVSITAHDANEPILRLSYDPKDDVVRVQVYANTHGHRGEVTHTILADVPGRVCEDCGGRGWAIFNGNEIQRCDTCKEFDTDEDAANHVAMMLDGTALKDQPQRQHQEKEPDGTPDPQVVAIIREVMGECMTIATDGGRIKEPWLPGPDAYAFTAKRVSDGYGREPTCREWIQAGYSCNCDGNGG